MPASPTATWATTRTAEKDLQEVAGSRYKEIASLAKMALAGVYHDTNRNMQAIDIYKQLIDHPTISVGKSSAQLALASLYEAMARPDDARHIYEQMQKESPASIVAQIANQKLQRLARISSAARGRQLRRLQLEPDVPKPCGLCFPSSISSAAKRVN